jgi:hypothetical protein
MITYSEERSLIEDIVEGIEIAMHRESYSSDAIDSIKINKLAFLAIQRFDLDITFGWYKYGPAPVDVANRGGAGGGSVTIDPQPAADITASDWPRVPSEKRDHPSPERYADCFQEHPEFHTALTTETRVYLTDFYDAYAPKPYDNLYIACAELQALLDKVADATAWTSLDDAYYRDMARALNTVHRKLLSVPRLSESVAAFRQFKHLFKTMIADAATQERTIDQQRRFISDLVEFFYGTIWEYTALLISKDTVRGANADRLRTSIEGDLGEIRLDYKRDLEELQDRLELLFERENRSDDTQDAERTDHVANVEAWSQLTSEVLRE